MFKVQETVQEIEKYPKNCLHDEQWLKVKSLWGRKKASEMLARHLAESSGTKVNTQSVRRNVGCSVAKAPFSAKRQNGFH